MGASGIKAANDGRRRLSETANCRDNGSSGQRGSTLGEAYAAGVLHLGALRSFEQQAEYGFTWSARSKGNADSMKGFAEIVAGDHGTSWPDLYTQQSLVFPCDIELVTGPNVVVPSLVRFVAFKNHPRVSGQSPYKFGSPVVSSRKIIETIGHGEISVVRVEDRFTFPDDAGEDIKAAANCIDVGSGLDAERKRQLRFLHRYYDVVRSWRIGVAEFYFNVAVEPGCESSIEGWELGYGPIDASLGL